MRKLTEPVTHRVCYKCLLDKPLTEGFYKDDHSTGGYGYMCKDCHKAYHKERRSKDVARAKAYYALYPQKRKEILRKNKYGITREEYDAMLVAQNYVCAICGKSQNRKTRGVLQPLSVDHDHKTGKIRGLLCHKCNIVLGLMGESPEMIPKIRTYLLHYRT